jgi:pimeloyl-ACP methyl ester carboxylesterase
MRSNELSSFGPHGFHRVHYVEWGDPDNDRVVVCVHGLTRNCRDFDALAGALRSDFRVVCPDMPGRGSSEWLEDPSDYGHPVYLATVVNLIARIGVETVHWVGTSMGGLIGMLLAAYPGNPVGRMVLNDVGPYVPLAAVARIAAYLAMDLEFESIDALEQHLRQIHAPFGPLSDTQWRHLAVHSTLHASDGSVRLHYDPGISMALNRAEPEAVDLWSTWEQVKCPVLVLRGSESDVLTAATARDMAQRQPGTSVVTFPGIGHAPALMADDQIALVRDWLSD